VYVCLINGSSIFSETIKKYTDSSFSHAGLSFDLSLNDIYTFNINGFTVEGFFKNKKYDPDTTFSLYRTMVNKDKLNEFKKQIETMYANKKNYSYNWMGILNLAVFKKERNFINTDSFFCSEFVSYSLDQMSDTPLFNKKYEFITPSDFTKAKFKFLYRGKVKNYSMDRIKK